MQHRKQPERPFCSGLSSPSSTGATTIFYNNNAVWSLSEDPLFHSCVKHVDIKYHAIRQHVQAQEVKLCYINTNDNIVIFTKALEATKFKSLQACLGLRRGPEASNQEEPCL